MMQDKQFRLLSALCPTMFEAPEVLMSDLGPRGGLRAWKTSRTGQTFPPSVIKRAEKLGLIKAGKITEQGQLRFQEALLARQESC